MIAIIFLSILLYGCADYSESSILYLNIENKSSEDLNVMIEQHHYSAYANQVSRIAHGWTCGDSRGYQTSISVTIGETFTFTPSYGCSDKTYLVICDDDACAETSSDATQPASIIHTIR